MREIGLTVILNYDFFDFNVFENNSFFFYLFVIFNLICECRYALIIGSIFRVAYEDEGENFQLIMFY